MKKKILAVLMGLVLVLSLFTACNSSDDEKTESNSEEAESQSTEESTDDKIVIGVTLHDLSSDGYVANLTGIEDFANELGNVEINAVSAEGSAETQVQQVEDFITAGVQGIIILPVDSSALATVVEKAVGEGIPVVSMDRSVEGDVATAVVESDNYKHGEAAAEYMLAAAESRGMTASDLKVLELLGAQSSSSGVERHEGFADKCEELGITIVASLPTEWDADEAYNSVLDGFQSNSEINAIFEASDIAMHSGVSAALEQLGKYNTAENDEHIIITSVDGGPQGLDSVREGYIDAMAEQALLEMGSQALDNVIAAINGESIEKLIQLSPIEVNANNTESDELWPNKIN